MKKTAYVYTISFPYIYILFIFVTIVSLLTLPQYITENLLIFLILGLEIFTCIIFYIFYILSSLYIVGDEDIIKKCFVIKMSHIFAHIIISIISMFLFSLIFTIGFSIIISIGQYMVLLVPSALCTITNIKNKDKFNDENKAIIYSIPQYIYVLDIVFTVIAYKELNKKINIEL